MTSATFLALAAICAPNIHPQTLHSVVRHESGYNAFAIGINKAPRLKFQPKNRSEAIAVANRLMKHNINFDAGLAQINITNLEWLSQSIEDLFDPCKNLKAASIILSDCYQRATRQNGKGRRALRAALSCYNTGNFNQGFVNGYVQKVIAQAQTYVPAITPEPATTDNSTSSEYDPITQEQKLGDAFSAPDADAFTRVERREIKQRKYLVQ